jgi:hypothetical protein
MNAQILLSAFLGLVLTTQVISTAQARVPQSEGVASVVTLRGEVRGKDVDGNVFDLEQGMWLPEGVILQSAERSFARLLFIDRSTMNLGPDSQLQIDKFPKDSAGIVTLMKGQVRSNVTKDYMQMDDEEKSKLYVKTKTAAMGVRGTDFQVNFNPNNDNTALITFSGAVSMAQIDMSSIRGPIDQNRLESVVSSDRAVLVREGEFSGVTTTTRRATVPTRINPVQFETLRQNETGISTPQEAGDERAQYRNPLPPGVDAKAFANDPRETAAQQVEGLAGPNAQAQVPEQSVVNRPPAEGFFNAATGEYAPPAGSVIDLATVNIIPPPPGSSFDPVSGTYTLPPELGAVNPATGGYEAPAGFRLGDDGRFVAVSTDGGRTPASEAPAPMAIQMPTAEPAPTITLEDLNSAMNQEDLAAIAEETTLDVERSIQESAEQVQIHTHTNATFRFNIAD